MGPKEKGLEMHCKLCYLSKERMQDFANNQLVHICHPITHTSFNCLAGCCHNPTWLKPLSATNVHQYHSLKPLPSHMVYLPCPGNLVSHDCQPFPTLRFSHISSKYFENLNVRPQTTKLLEGNRHFMNSPDQVRLF